MMTSIAVIFVVIKQRNHEGPLWNRWKEGQTDVAIAVVSRKVFKVFSVEYHVTLRVF
ncbi:hypothetical protein KP509_02G001500 [Ceratopteris richardii]|uniref:Uncharacterized protein n=1 Tax=Ceratopteris richardii TaxID=49495 RepID=A0A8T2VEA9_CERRI|nr:hypothetical protein KP509_02G001500 [Ceratopteris richardii]